VHENKRIRDELCGVIYGIWNYIKNSGQFDAENMTLEWVGALPGKREYRRFVGDYVLNQNDILAQTPFERTPFEIIPELVRDYRLEACVDGRWQTIAEVRGNRRRKQVHRIEPPVATDQLRALITATNGSARAELIEVRVYGDEGDTRLS
jgi:hypothetical protein